MRIDHDLTQQLAAGAITAAEMIALQRQRDAGQSSAAPASAPPHLPCRAAGYAAAAAWAAAHGGPDLQAKLALHVETVEPRRPAAEGGNGSLPGCVVARHRREIVAAARAAGWKPETEESGAMQTENGEPAAAPGTVDLVVPLGTGSKHGDLELRYLLRSALENLRGLRTIHLIGPRPPAWLRPHPRVLVHAWKPDRLKNHDIIRKFLHAASLPEVSETFVASCDDWAFLLPVAPGADWGAVHRGGVLSNDLRAGYWKRCQAATRIVLTAARKPVLFYDCHTPSVMTKAGWLQVEREVKWRQQNDHAVWSLYHNVAGVHGPVVGAATHCGWHAGDGSSRPKGLAEIQAATAGRWFLQYNDAGLTADLRGWLAERFPEPAPWEVLPAAGAQGSTPAPRKAAPAAAPAKAAPAAPVAVTATAAMADTALVLGYSREDERRHAATITALAQLRRLDPMPQVVFLELSRDPSPDLAAAVRALPGARYEFLPAQDRHAGLFHKEDLWNLGASRYVPPEVPVLLWMDADCYPLSADWAGRARDAILAAGPGVVLQPWSSFRDTVDPHLSGPSAASVHGGKVPDRRAPNPGLCLGMLRECWQAVGGFPASCPCGAGDTMFMGELTGGEYAPAWIPAYPYFAHLRRQIPARRVQCIREEFVHVHHGTREERGYNLRHHLLGLLHPWGEGVRLDADGLLSVEPGAALQMALRLRKLCHDERECEALVATARDLCGPPVCSRLRLEAAAAQRAYWQGRWPYYQAAANLLQALPRDLRKPLEVGPWDCPLCLDATYMDIADHGVGAIIHDAGTAPWPFADRQFSAVVALQVIEHAADRGVFVREALRVAGHLVLSVPWQWPDGDPGHAGIGWPEVHGWTGGARPVVWHLLGKPPRQRMLLLYRAPGAAAL